MCRVVDLACSQQTVKPVVQTENSRKMELKRVEASQMFTADGQCCEIKMCSLEITWENSEQVINLLFKIFQFYTLVDMLFKCCVAFALLI